MNKERIIAAAQRWADAEDARWSVELPFPRTDETYLPVIQERYDAGEELYRAVRNLPGRPPR